MWPSQATITAAGTRFGCIRVAQLCRVSTILVVADPRGVAPIRQRSRAVLEPVPVAAAVASGPVGGQLEPARTSAPGHPAPAVIVVGNGMSSRTNSVG